MRFWAASVVVLLSSAIGTCASSLYKTETLIVNPEMANCKNGCYVAAAGWPLPYIADDAPLSPATSVSLVGALRGVNQVLAYELAITYINWFNFAVIGVWLILRAKHKAAH